MDMEMEEPQPATPRESPGTDVVLSDFEMDPFHFQVMEEPQPAMPREAYSTGRTRGATKDDNASQHYASITTNFSQKSTAPFPRGIPRYRLLATIISAPPGEAAAEAYRLYPSFTSLAEGLILGNTACVESEVFLREMGITAVITVLEEPVSTSPNHPLLRTIPREDRLFLRACEIPTQDMIQFFPGACYFIDSRLRPHHYNRKARRAHAREQANNQPEASSPSRDPSSTAAVARARARRAALEAAPLPKVPKKPPQHRVLLHSSRGHTRSAAVAVAYLMYRRGRDAETTLAAVERRCARGGIRDVWPLVPALFAFGEQLQLWWDVRFRLYSDGVFKLPCEAYEAYLTQLSLEKAKWEDFESSE